MLGYKQRRGALGVVGCVLALGCSDVPAVEPEPEPVVTLLHTSDIHSRIWPFRVRVSAFDAHLGLGEEGELEEVGGFARLASLLERERRRAPASVWLDSGDALEGAEVFHRLGGRLEVELLGKLGLAAMALGNHELSLDAAELAELATLAQFPLLAANLAPRAASALRGRLASSALVRAGRLRLGIIGVANPTSPPNLNAADNPWQLALASDSASAVQAAIDEVAWRADVVVLLSHLGLEADRALLRATTGVDVLLGGHQHIFTLEPEWSEDCTDEGRQAERSCSPRLVPIVHSGAYGEQLSRVELTLARDWNGGYEVAGLSLSRMASAGSVPEQPAMLDILAGVELGPEQALAFVSAPVARHGALGGDSPLGDLLTDALRAAAGADVALVNSSGLRADLEAGVLLRSDLELLFPFAEAWRVGWASGRALREGLERAARRSAERDCTSSLQVSGLRLQLRCAACRAGRSDCLTIARPTRIGDARLGESELFRVILPSYLTLTGADFEAFAAWEASALGPIDALIEQVGRLTSGQAVGCEAQILAATPARCRSLFGSAACPASAERARALCRSLPVVEGERDDRIQMLP
jgi:5'-nucleotidase / UDP-sugar diphosphatase